MAWTRTDYLGRCAGCFAAALLMAVVSTRPAAAFCRTTSSPAAVGYDPAQVGACWSGPDGGRVLDLAWPSRSRVPYSLVASASSQVTVAAASAVAHLAFDAWAGRGDAGMAPLCPGGPPNVEAFDNGPVAQSVADNDCGLNQCADTVHDANHLIVFRDNGWPHSDPVNTLALTTVTYGRITGTIFDADIEINSTAPNRLTTEEPAPPGGYPPNTYDLRAVLTHEAGHFLGLAHATDPKAIMYAFYAPGSVDLTPDDTAGICTIYPPLPPVSGGCTFASGRPGGGFVAAAIGLVFVGVGRRRTRGVIRKRARCPRRGNRPADTRAS